MQANLASALIAAGRTDEAAAVRQRALTLLEGKLGPRASTVLYLKLQAAYAASEADRVDEAIALERQLVDDYGRARPPQTEDQAYALNNLGWDLIGSSAAEALPLLARSRALFEQLMGAEGIALISPLTGEGLALFELGRAAEARVPLERALRLSEAPGLSESTNRAETELVLARVLGGGARALALARDGRDVLAAHPFGRRRARLVAEADAWIAAHAGSR
jgi:tetratricopeptide (TPR) repeat protein